MKMTKDELCTFIEHTINLLEEIMDNLHDIKTEVKNDKV